MALKFRFDFPPEVVAEREQVFAKMRGLVSENTLPAIKQACILQTEWLKRYPDDYAMIDAGEMLGMSESALTATAHNHDALLSPVTHEQLQEA